MCWDLRVRACVPACLRDGWVGWIGSSFLCLVPGSCWSAWLGVMGRWCCCFGGGESVEVGGYLFSSGECRVLTLGCHSCFRGMDVHSRKKIHVKTDRTFLLHTIDASLVLVPD